MKRALIFFFIALVAGSVGILGHAQTEDSPPAATMKQLMLDLIYPSSNDLLLHIYRGGPMNESDWASVRRDAMTLSESGNLLMTPSRMKDQNNWTTHVKMLTNVGTAAYKAAQEKDAQALSAVAKPLDAACTSCHQEYRPNVFPKQGGSK